jgi:hypothetical protein
MAQQLAKKIGVVFRGSGRAMHRDVIAMELTAEERTLLLRYGYPFARIQAALEACQASTGIETVPLDVFELNQLIGDLCRSINDMKRNAVQNKLLDLCDRLEAAQRYGDGQLDEL